MSHTQHGSAAPAEIETQVRSLIAASKCKQAVELAKDAHKRSATVASEALLVQAYVARIHQFQAKGAVEDACTLIKLVRDRFPGHQAALLASEIQSAAALGKIDDLVRPLARADVSPEMRDAIESVIRRSWTDLPALANCAALAADHPLRTNAAALHNAFVAATSGPVTEEQIALAEVSRRSPLAGWKLLIRAVASLYRQDDEACRRALGAIAEDAAVRRLAPVLLHLMDPNPGGAANPRIAQLKSRIAGGEKALRQAISELDKAFEGRYIDDLFSAIRRALASCDASAPDLADTLRQRIAVRGEATGISFSDLVRLMGSVPRNAEFWRMTAKTYEKGAQWWHAAIHWERFLAHALHEKWFAPNGPETATIYAHMAGLAANLSPHMLEQLRYRARQRKLKVGAMYKGQPGDLASLAPKDDLQVADLALNPDLLFRKAAELGGDAETFSAWLSWSKKAKYTNDQLQDLARLWQQKLPNDPQAPLLLSSLAEQRKALKLSLKHLAEAEQIDPMNPAVRKARLRLVLGTSWKHLKDQKPHLLESDLAQLESLPAMKDGDRGLLLIALRASCHAIKQDPENMQRVVAQLVSAAGPLLAQLLIDSVYATARVGQAAPRPIVPATALPDPHALVEAQARAHALGFDLDLTVPRTRDCNRFIMQVLHERPVPLTSAQLATLARAALDDQYLEQAYLACSAALTSATGATAARFLLMRGRSLMHLSGPRVCQCLRAAMELARQANDAALMNEIAEAIDDHPWTRDSVEQTPRLGEDLPARILEQERKAAVFPRDSSTAGRYVVFMESALPRGSFDPFSTMDLDDEEDEFDDDFDDDDDEDGAQRSEVIDKQLLEKFGGKVPSIEDLMGTDSATLADLLRTLTGLKINPDTVDAMRGSMGPNSGKSARRGKTR